MDPGNAYLPSVELIRLTTLAGLEPEVRLQRVQQVAERLRQGYYDAPERAAETAQIITSAID